MGAVDLTTLSGGNQASWQRMKDDVIGMKLKPTIAPRKQSLYLVAVLGITSRSCAGPNPNRSLQSSVSPVPANSIRLTSFSDNPSEETGIGYLYETNFKPEAHLQGPS